MFSLSGGVCCRRVELFVMDFINYLTNNFKGTAISALKKKLQYVGLPDFLIGYFP